ncbi:MAG: cobalt ECF transporter T component CbiQ [Methanothrix sp.]|nr:cobalt ECF transporter T component CbiQ [Methanothrix sp.]
MIPDWMNNVDLQPGHFSAGRHGKKGFIGKTIEGTLGFLEEAFLSESYRVKLLSILAVVFAASMISDLKVLVAIYLLTLLITYLSKIGVGFFIKRVWLFIPIFAGIIAIPMIFNVFLPGDPLYTIIHLGAGAHLGPFSLPESTMRVATCVSAVVLLFLTTPQQILFKSLRTVGVPKIYVLTLQMTYRYIFLLMEQVREMYIAKKARTIKSRGLIDDQKWVGGRIGYTLIRSLSMSEKVHMAMLSRGFSGEVHIMQEFKMSQRDYLAGAAAISISLVLVLISQDIIRV